MLFQAIQFFPRHWGWWLIRYKVRSPVHVGQRGTETVFECESCINQDLYRAFYEELKNSQVYKSVKELS